MLRFGLLAFVFLVQPSLADEPQAANAAKIGKAFEGAMRRQYSGTPPMQRPVFGKDYGCLIGKFEITNRALAKEANVTLFKKDWYPAWIRFAKDSAPTGSDGEKGISKSMSIKLVEVEGPKILPGEETAVTQDFLMTNHPTFFSKTADDFWELLTSPSDDDKEAKAKWNKAHPDTVRVMAEMKKNVLADPLDGTYWTAVPYQFGKEKMKYKAEPCVKVKQPPTKPMHGDNFLRANAKEHLKQKEPICFNFLIQLQGEDENEYPLDDATKQWPEVGKSKYQPFAKLTIPSRQNIDDPKRMARCENLSYTGWHASAELTPQGSLNDVRKIVYKVMADIRRAENKKTEKDPTLMDEPTKLDIPTL